MDLLIEKLDGSRYYLSQYKVLITDFEESAPSVTRNSMKLDQRNGNIDFGGWHTNKTINITGYYRADGIDEEEALRERLYALLSDPNGYYITQLKATPNMTMERPGETSGGYYDKLSNYPSHKRFLVYTEAPKMELVGNVNGTLLYKLTAEFKTIKLPYGETPAVDIAIDSPYKDVPVNLLTGTSDQKTSGTIPANNWNVPSQRRFISATAGQKFAYQIFITNDNTIDLLVAVNVYSGNTLKVQYKGNVIKAGTSGYSSVTFTIPSGADTLNVNGISAILKAPSSDTAVHWQEEKLSVGTTASPWTPNPADPEYAHWYYKGSSISYRGTVPCSQLEQGFTVQLTATDSASSLSFKIDDNELTSSNAVAAGDVFMFSGFSYTQNKLSIVNKTNKAYFILQPDKPNRITCNVPGTVRIIGFQNLYA